MDISKNKRRDCNISRYDDDDASDDEDEEIGPIYKTSNSESSDDSILDELFSTYIW